MLEMTILITHDEFTLSSPNIIQVLGFMGFNTTPSTTILCAFPPTIINHSNHNTTPSVALDPGRLYIQVIARIIVVLGSSLTKVKLVSSKEANLQQ